MHSDAVVTAADKVQQLADSNMASASGAFAAISDLEVHAAALRKPAEQFTRTTSFSQQPPPHRCGPGNARQRVF
ncbi:MAG: hypothetical protein R3F38_08670 [Gammaproteobacteria bacterium]